MICPRDTGDFEFQVCVCVREKCRVNVLLTTGVYLQSVRFARFFNATVLFVSSVLCCSQARFPFKRNRLRCVRCVNENPKKRKRWRWQAANHGSRCKLRISPR